MSSQSSIVMVLNSLGRLGIGIPRPDNRLTIKTTYNTENTGLMSDASDGTTYKISFFSYVVGGGLVGHKFKLYNSSSVFYNMLGFAPNGNVGIHNTNPPQKLTINGNILASGGDVIARDGNTGHSFSCRGEMSEGTTNSGRVGLHIRHNNNTQGISIGYAGIIANGTSNNGIIITSRGTHSTFNGTGTTASQ